MPAIDRGLDSSELPPLCAARCAAPAAARVRRPDPDRAAAALALALATWSVQDPSLSHATNKPMHNVLGMAGAVVADLLMQLFGVAALALVLPVAHLGLAPRHPSAVAARAHSPGVLAHRHAARRRLRGLPAAHRGLAAARRARRRHRRLPAPPAGHARRRHALRLPRGCRRHRGRHRDIRLLCHRGGLRMARSRRPRRQTHDDSRSRTTRRTKSAPRSRSAGSPTSFLSLKARLARLLTRRSPPRAASAGEAAARGRAEPHFDDARARHAGAAA